MEIVQYVISATDLAHICGKMLDDAFVRFAAQHTAINQDGSGNTLISANDVCRLFGVTRNTLWKWDKTGYLKCIKVGRSVFYNSDDVERIKAHHK